MAKKKAHSGNRFIFTLLVLFLLLLLPVLVIATMRNTFNIAQAAPIAPVLAQVTTGRSTNSNSVTASSVARSASAFYLATVTTKPYVPVRSMSGLGLNWTKLDLQCGARSTTGVEMWMAMGSPTSGSSVTASFSIRPVNSIIAVSRFTGVDLSDPVSDVISYNTRGRDGSCTGGTDRNRYSLPLQSDRNSITFGAIATRLRTHTAGSGFSEVLDIQSIGGDNGDKAGLALVQAYQLNSVNLTMGGTLSSEMDWAAAAVQVHGVPEVNVPLPTVVISVSPSLTPTPRPGTTLVPTVRPTVVPTNSPAPTSGPLSPVTGIWTSASELASKPMSGDAWNAVRAAADSLSASANPDLDDQEDDTNVQVLAAAIVYARNGNAIYRTKVVNALQKVESFTPNGRTLAWARETGAYAMAADLVGYRTTAFQNKMRAMAETYKGSQLDKSLLEMYRYRPNNWGSQAFGSLTAIYSYLGDRTKLAEVRNYMIQSINGPTPSQARYGSLSWQCDESNPKWINPQGCYKTCNGVRVNVDGIIPDDMRRGGGCSSNPGATGYPWEGLQGFVMGARVLERAGMPIWSEGNRAICRAASAVQDGRFGSSWRAVDDDEWQLPFLDRACGTNWASSYGTGKWGHGKNTGWAYVL